MNLGWIFNGAFNEEFFQKANVRKFPFSLARVKFKYTWDTLPCLSRLRRAALTEP